MEGLKCVKCNSEKLIKENNRVVCKDCGTKYYYQGIKVIMELS